MKCRRKVKSLMLLLLIITLINPVSGGLITKIIEIEKIDILNRGEIFYVGGSGPENYTYIRDAINDASDGDTVFVYDDSSPYSGRFNIDKSINVIGENKNTTILESNSHNVYIEADNVYFSDFTISGNGSLGIKLWESMNCIVENNIILGIGQGIAVFKSNYNYILRNEIFNGGCGIDISSDSYYNQVEMNTLLDNECGIKIREGPENNIVSNNNLINNGFAIWDSFNNTFYDNSINGKPLVYLENECNRVFDGINVGEIILINCNNIVIKNLEISDSTYGVELIHSDGCFISNNTFHSNEYGGISLLGSCNNNTINDNYISSNFDGINIYSYYEDRCNYNNINGNYIVSNRVNGIHIFDSNDNIVSGNIIQGNGFQPSYFLFGSGIFLEIDANDNIISNNIIEDNFHGISLRDSMDNSITYNHITNSSTIGLYLDNSVSNSIKYNNIVDNKKDARFIKYSIVRNDLRSNYWAPWIGFGPKIIFGQRMIQWGYDRHGYPMYFPIPWIGFDWNPANEPFNIEV